MRYFIPAATAGWIDGGPQTTPKDHFGGVPWGVPAARWPRCRSCGHAMTFQAQFVHHPPRLDLGAEGRVLYLFWCVRDPGACDIWEPYSGANAALVLERAERTDIAEAPSDAQAGAYLPIVSWTEGDDGVPEEVMAALRDPDRALDVDPDAFRIPVEDRLGGAPLWPQGIPMNVFDADVQLVAHLSEGRWQRPPAPSADALGCTVIHQPEVGGRSRFERIEPAVRKPLAPREVVVADDGTWAAYDDSGFSIFVYVRADAGRAEAWICFES